MINFPAKLGRFVKGRVHVGSAAAAHDEILAACADASALTAIAPLARGFVPLTASAMRPSALQFLVNEVTVNNRRNAIEFGSGISTAYLAAALQNIGGTLVSFEHDEAWIAVVSDILRAWGVDDIVELVHAPLATRDGETWYEREYFSSNETARYDLVVIDGPPAYSKEFGNPRRHTFSALKDLMADRCTIVLDDAFRPGEAEILDEWERRYSIKFERRQIAGGIAVTRLGSHYHA